MKRRQQPPVPLILVVDVEKTDLSSVADMLFQQANLLSLWYGPLLVINAVVTPRSHTHTHPHTSSCHVLWQLVPCFAVSYKPLIVIPPPTETSSTVEWHRRSLVHSYYCEHKFRYVHVADAQFKNTKEYNVFDSFSTEAQQIQSALSFFSPVKMWDFFSPVFFSLCVMCSSRPPITYICLFPSAQLWFCHPCLQCILWAIICHSFSIYSIIPFCTLVCWCCCSPESDPCSPKHP